MAILSKGARIEKEYRGGGLNLNAYYGNNSLMYYDPSGHEQEYSDDFTTESGKSRAEQVDGELHSGVNIAENGSLDFEGGSNFVNSNKQQILDALKDAPHL